MLDLLQGPLLSIDRGPGWLFIKLVPPTDGPCDFQHVAEQLWTIAEQHFTYRIVVELDELIMLPSCLLGQLVQLHKRVAKHNGVMRLCGLSAENRGVLRSSRLEPCFPHYGNREEAVWGHRPAQPR
jgi:anti-anti-sigma factor